MRMSESVLVCTPVCLQACGSQETTYFSPPIMKDWPQLPSLAAGTLTCRAISRTYLQSVYSSTFSSLRQGLTVQSCSQTRALHVPCKCNTTEPYHQPDSPGSSGPLLFNKLILGSFSNHLQHPTSKYHCAGFGLLLQWPLGFQVHSVCRERSSLLPGTFPLSPSVSVS